MQEEASFELTFRSIPHAKVQRHPLPALVQSQAALHGEEIKDGWGTAFYLQGALIAGYGHIGSLLRAECRLQGGFEDIIGPLAIIDDLRDAIAEFTR